MYVHKNKAWLNKNIAMQNHLKFTLILQNKVLLAKILIKFIYSEKTTKFCEIFPLLLTVCTAVKTKGKISQNFVAFSEYMNFNYTGSRVWISSMGDKKIG